MMKIKRFNENKSERAKKTDIIRDILEKLSADILKNLVSDNRKEILKTISELINLHINWEKEGTKQLKVKYTSLINSIPEHIKRHV